MVVIHCRHRLPTPETTGAVSWDVVKAWAALYPHLRPCPRQKGARGTWDWVYRDICGKCPERKAENALVQTHDQLQNG